MFSVKISLIFVSNDWRISFSFHQFYFLGWLVARCQCVKSSEGFTLIINYPLFSNNFSDFYYFVLIIFIQLKFLLLFDVLKDFIRFTIFIPSAGWLVCPVCGIVYRPAVECGCQHDNQLFVHMGPITSPRGVNLTQIIHCNMLHSTWQMVLILHVCFCENADWLPCEEIQHSADLLGWLNIKKKLP